MSETPHRDRSSRASKTLVLPSARRDDCWNHIGVRGDQSCPELKTHVHCRNCPVFMSSGRGLLERFMAADYRAELTTQLAREKILAPRSAIALFGFRLHDEWLALPAGLLIEVAELKMARRVPYRSNPVFKGMANIGGELQLCVSLHKLLNISEPASGPAARLAVVEKDRARWVFPVDEVLGVVRCEASELEKPPVTVSKAASPHIKAVLKNPAAHGAGKRAERLGVLDDELVCYQLARSVQ